MIHGLAKVPFDSREIHPISELTTNGGMRVACYAMPIERVPADFFADPDGSWTYESLARAAGFGTNEVAIGALKRDFNGHPEGSAVVTLNCEARPYIAIVECPIAYSCVADAERVGVTAA